VSSPGVLLCMCRHAGVFPQEVAGEVLGGLNAAGVAVEVVDDLCGLAVAGDPRLKRIADLAEPCIIACHPRATRWLFHAGGAPLDAAGARLFDMRTQTAEEILAAVAPKGVGAPPAEFVAADEPDWQPWFPVVDYERCVGCRQCHGFCLFGVYVLSDDGRVRVANPANCKYGCPACARICPAGAIVFPKHEDDAISGRDLEAKAEPAKGELKSLLEGDVLDALRRRGVQAKPADVRKALDARMGES